MLSSSEEGALKKLSHFDIQKGPTVLAQEAALNVKKKYWYGQNTCHGKLTCTCYGQFYHDNKSCTNYT